MTSRTVHTCFAATAMFLALGFGRPALAGHDADRDGYDALVDCDDNDPAIHPGAPELCDGIDNNCVFGPDEEDLPYVASSLQPVTLFTYYEGELVDAIPLSNLLGSSYTVEDQPHADEVELRFCDGPYYVDNIHVTASVATISSLNGYTSTTIKGIGTSSVLTVATRRLTIAGLTIEDYPE